MLCAGVYDKHVAQPATRGRQSPDRPHNTPAKSHHVAQPHFTHAAGSPDAHQQPAPHRPSSTQRSFGTQRRWYQPGQAADHAAALQRQALAAAAAEREVVDADWLLSTAPRGLSVSHQPSTFGSELRWWETKSGLGLDGPKADHRDASQHAQQSQKPCSRQTSPSQPRQRYPDGVCPLQVSHGLPEQVLPKKKCTFGSASRWFEYSDNNAVKHTSNASPAPASHHLASATYPSQRSVSRGNAAVPDHSKGISQSRTSAHAPPHSGNSRRPNSTDRGTVHPTSLPRFDRTSWSSDSTAASSAVLQRIQEKHAQIQQLAAMISQQQSAAGGGGRASKFGPDLQRGADSSGRATEATFQAPMPQKAAQVEGQGSNPSMQSTQSATAPAVDPAVHDPDSTVMPSQELPGKSGESLSQAAHGRPAELDPVRDMPVQQPRSSRLSNEQPASVSRLGRSTLDDHSASTSSFPYPPAPSLGAQSGASPIADDILPSLSSRGLMTNPSSTWLRGDWTSPVNPPGTHTLDRSGSASPSLRRTASIYDRSDLQEDIRNRCAWPYCCVPTPRNSNIMCIPGFLVLRTEPVGHAACL